MSALATYRKLSGAERRLLLQALVLLGVARLGLRVARLQSVRRWVSRAARIYGTPGTLSARRIAWAVEAASRRLPGLTRCLPKAVVGQALLAREGYGARLRIGVARPGEGSFAAHAWVECEGAALIGGGELERYRLLLEIGPGEAADSWTPASS